MKMISELVEGDVLTIQALVGNANKCINNVGAFYLNLELKDASGVINGKKWEVVGDDETIFVLGNVIEAKVEILKYRDALQCKVISAKLLNAEEIDTTRFLKSAPIPKEELTKRMNAVLATVKDTDCEKIIRYFLDKTKDKFYDYPAAASIHHEYMSGLLMHTTSMLELASFIETKYPDINHDLLMTGIFLHDIGKVIELEGPAVFHYSTEGKLLGHISIMAGEIRIAAKELGITSEVPTLLEHIVLSHHGQLEFGSPVLPLTKEAFLVNLIDNLDSRMTILTKAYEGIEKGDFTQKVFALDNRCFYIC